jgi:Beta-ketoacyl synthase, N-terminal domain
MSASMILPEDGQAAVGAPEITADAQTAAVGAFEVTADAQTAAADALEVTADAQTAAATDVTMDAVIPGAAIGVAIDVAIDVAAAEPADVEPPDGTTILACSRWPDGEPAELPAIAGFIASGFSPLAAALAERCLADYFGSRPADTARGERTAIVLASSTGDLSTCAAIATAVDQRRRVPPLLFFQSNPGAVVGYISARWGLSGPAACINPAGAALPDAIAVAGLLIEDGDADAALVIVADAAPRAQPHGTALLIGPPTWPSVRTARAALAAELAR